jgi:C4-dicarboxylate transporter DctM subunit
MADMVAVAASASTNPSDWRTLMDPLSRRAGRASSPSSCCSPASRSPLGLLIVSAGFLIVFDGMRSLELMPEILFGKLNNFALLSIPMFIIMGAAIASTRAGADLYEALERWLTRVPGGLVVSNLGACALFSAMSGPAPRPVRPSARWASPRCASAAIPTRSPRAPSRRAARWAS